MNIQQMQKRYDEIEQELERIHDELAARVPKASEAEMEAAQAALVAECTRLQREYAVGKQRNDLVGKRVYDKINDCVAVVTRTSKVAGESLCLHLRSDDGQEWCQWPRNVEERDAAETGTVIHSTAIEDICDPRSGEVIVPKGETVNRRQAQWLGLLIDIGEIEFSELWDVLDTIPY